LRSKLPGRYHLPKLSLECRKRRVPLLSAGITPSFQIQTDGSFSESRDGSLLASAEGEFNGAGKSTRWAPTRREWSERWSFVWLVAHAVSTRGRRRLRGSYRTRDDGASAAARRSARGDRDERLLKSARIITTPPRRANAEGSGTPETEESNVTEDMVLKVSNPPLVSAFTNCDRIVFVPDAVMPVVRP